MIDYEFRLVTPTIRELVKKKLKSEKYLIEKIPAKHITIENLKKLNFKYFSKLMKINSIVYRSLPINNLQSYFKNENETLVEFLKLKKDLKEKYKKNIIGKRVIQIPNPNKVSLSKFKNYLKKTKKNDLWGFELIPMWHLDVRFPEDYYDFFKMIQKSKKNLSIEINLAHKDKFSEFFNFFRLMKKFPRLKITLSKLGSGLFLYNNFLSHSKNKITLMSSAPKSLNWLDILQNKKFSSSFYIKFGSDHPFNGNMSKKIYDEFLKFENKN